MTLDCFARNDGLRRCEARSAEAIQIYPHISLNNMDVFMKNFSYFFLLFAIYVFADTPAQEWRTVGGDPGQTHYSSLSDITPHNVRKLQTAWTYTSSDFSNGSARAGKTAFEATPIIWQQTLYFCTPFNRIVALDAATGKERWNYLPQVNLTRDYAGPLRCRGVTLWEDHNAAPNTPCQTRIYEGTMDGRLIAVDARNGQVCKQFGNNGEINLNNLENYSKKLLVMISSAPVVYKDTIITGSAINDNQFNDSPHGIVNAFDARTGQVKWRWDPVPPEMAHNTGAMNTWSNISVDEERGLVFLPTTSPSNDYFGGTRLQPLPNENAVVVLNAETGKLVWNYQTVRHNLWDYDLASAPVLINVQRDGKTIPAIAQGTKSNLIFILDRLTGKPLFPIKEVPVPSSDVPGEITSPTQPIPTLPKPLNSLTLKAEDAFGLVYFDYLSCRRQIEVLNNSGIFTPPSLHGSLAYPGPMGGINWGGMAYDPKSNLLFVNSSNLAYSIYLFPTKDFKPIKERYQFDEVSPMHGTPYGLRRTVLLSPLGVPCSPPPWGKLTAIEVNTGEVRWSIPFGGVRKGPFVTPKKWGSPTLGGSLVTKSGLLFIGASMDNLFHAYNLWTGELLWETRVPADAIATPVTYAINDKQYVVIAAGGGRISNATSGALVAFTLPERAPRPKPTKLLKNKL